MLSSFERERDFRKSLFASAQASAATRFPALNAERLIPRLAYSRNWPRRAASGREGNVGARALIAAIDEAAGHDPTRYSRAGRPRLVR